ncbi:hypothetical protein ESCO_006181 [Escovopsis weberi]|uniref:Uncharacterized protein n=1 Tax=Escovopsis weberi TaxID=150374 RepID=A0A0M8MVI5_ESCWE|nr:hypothetical protein ESCO_006181 [Escovopsis weberi]
MAFKTFAAAIALASSLTSVSAAFCQNPVTTSDGFNFILSDSPIPNTNNKPLQIRPSKTGDFSYVAIDNSSPALTVNYDNGVLVQVGQDLAPTGATGFLSNYNLDFSVNPPTTVGTLAFASTAVAANASDPNWILNANSATHWSLWHQVPSNTYSGMQICKADFDLNEDGSDWYYFQYVNWVSKFPTNCEFLAFVATIDSTDANSC